VNTAKVGDVLNKGGLGKLSRPRCQMQWSWEDEWLQNGQA